MSVEERVHQVIRDVLADDEVVLTDATTAAEVEGWDSLAHINIMFALESEFDVQFTDDQLSSFRDLGELRRFLAGADADVRGR
ncbi:acyl carrier protein [Modestobacter versicolor]|uniref:acyl carrier protein n=1 Tax=Modestobacter versicolor TaxID=429133 RepID=UPI0034DF85B7